MRNRLALVTALCSMVIASSAPAEQIYLLADFNDKTIDAPIGTGGPTVGEPVSVFTDAIEATVRATPMPTPCLQITDIDDYFAGAARFEFLEDAEITSGWVVIRMQLWFPEVEGRASYVAVREHAGAAQSFLDLDFTPDGRVNCGDKNGYVGIIGTYPTGQVVPIRIAFDMTAGTYDITIHGTPMLLGRAHGVTEAGIGSVLIGCTHDANVGDYFCVDNIYVADGDPTPAEPSTWGAVKTQFLGAE